MIAQEIAERMLGIIQLMPIEYAAMEDTRLAWKQSELDAEQEETKAYLKHKAEFNQTVETSRRAALEGTYHFRLEAVKKEAEYKKREHRVAVLRDELDIMRSLFAFERTKLERGVEM